MKFFRLVVYSIVLLLSCEVVKAVVAKTQAPWSYYVGTIMLSLQLLILLALLLIPVFRLLAPRRQTPGRRWLVAGSIFLLLVVVLECLFCWWLRHPEKLPSSLLRPFRYYYEQYDRRIVQYDDRLAIYDSTLFYTLIPGVDGRFGNAEFSTRIQANSKGLRDDEASLQKPSVICLGDSYAMGWGVEEADAFPRQLESLTGVKVLNGAMSSYGTAREMMRLQHLDTSAVQYLVIQYCFNDYGENAQMLSHGGKLPISSHAKFDSLTLLENWNARYFPGKVFLTVSQAYLKMQFNKIRPTFNLREAKEDDEVPGQAANFLQVLDAQPIDYRNKQLLIVLVDDLKYTGNTFAQELKRLLQQPPYTARFAGGVEVIDMYDRLTGEDYFILDPHLRPAGHRKIAEAIGEHIKH